MRGESGRKELVARELHERSAARRPARSSRELRGAAERIDRVGTFRPRKGAFTGAAAGGAVI